MAISKKHQKVVYLADYRKKPVSYALYTEPEFPQPGQPGYCGTYTPPPPYGRQEEDDKDADR